MIRTRSPATPAIVTRDIVLFGNAYAEGDTVRLQEAINAASSQNRPLQLSGTFDIRAPLTPTFPWRGIATRQVYTAVTLRSDVAIRGPAIIRPEPPTIALSSLSKFGMLGVDQNYMEPGSIRNVSIEDLTFDFGDHFTGGTLPTQTYGLLIIGGEIIRRTNIKHLVSARAITATISGDTMTAVGHGMVASNATGYWTTTGTLPPEFVAYRRYLKRNTLTDTFQLSEQHDDALITASGPGTGVHTWHHEPRRGCGALLENIYDLKDVNLDHRGVLQGVFLAYVKAYQFDQYMFNRVSECFDLDGPCEMINGGQMSLINCSGTDEGLDLSTVKDSNFANILIDHADTGIFIYNKLESFETYEECVAHRNQTLTIPIGGVIAWPSTVPDHADGDRFYLSTLTGAAPFADDTIYFVVNWDGGARTFQLSATEGGPPITPAAPGTGTLVFVAMPLAINENVRFSNIIGANMVGRLFAISARRNTSNDSVWRTDQPQQARNITIDGFKGRGGTGVLVNEGEYIEINNGTMQDIVMPMTNDIPPEPNLSVPHAAFAFRQSDTDSKAVADSRLSITGYNLKVFSCEVSGFIVDGASDYDLHRLFFDNFNSLGSATTGKVGFAETRARLKQGIRAIGDITAGSGGANSVDMSVRDNGGTADPVYKSQGRWTLPNTTGAAVPDIDLYIGKRFEDRRTFAIPRIDTTSATGSTPIKLLIESASNQYRHLNYASLINLAAVVGAAAHTTVNFRKYTVAGVDVSLSSGLPMELNSWPINTEREVGVDELTNQVILKPGESLYLQFDRQAGGSIIAEGQWLLTYLLIEYTA